MSHPPAPKLDAVAAGDADPAVMAHVATCEPCAAYVAELTEGAAAFRSGANPGAFAAKVKDRDARAPRARRVVSIGWAAPLLAAAAAVVLWLRAPASPDYSEPTVDTVALPTPADQPRFKGEKIVAVVRERDGKQTRLMGPFTVRAGDRVRVEVGVDREGPVTSGLLAADGAWTLLFAPAVLEAGVHYSDLAARFDESPVDAVLLVGPPDAVDRARRTRDLAGVVAWRVTREEPR